MESGYSTADIILQSDTGIWQCTKMHTPLIQGYEKILGSNGLKCPFNGMKPIKQS